jgi:hypothetical protein
LEIIVSMLDAATRPPSGCRPVVEKTCPSGCATVFISRPLTTVMRSTMSARSPIPGPNAWLLPLGRTSSNVLKAPSAIGASTQCFSCEVSVFSVEAGWMMPRTSLRGSAHRVTSHPPSAMRKTKNSVSFVAWATSAIASCAGRPAHAAAAPAVST